jgi:hypothetical protein
LSSDDEEDDTRAAAGNDCITPYVILDEYDIAENSDRYCNHGFGRAAREYAWHTALHGLKYTVFDRERTAARVCWGVVMLVLFATGIWISVCAAAFLNSDPPVFMSVDKMGLADHEVSMPGVTICPPGRRRRQNPIHLFISRYVRDISTKCFDRNPT